MSYSRFIAGLHRAEVAVDRKVLADVAVRDPVAFAALVKVASDALGDEAVPEVLQAEESDAESEPVDAAEDDEVQPASTGEAAS
ncbi:MAG: ribosomal protein [Acidimicrobiaceae bacterium]|nr:ribosomal protein [Acidimicrobiaceae bacterium]